jgi:hypothetical protein
MALQAGYRFVKLGLDPDNRRREGMFFAHRRWGVALGKSCRGDLRRSVEKVLPRHNPTMPFSSRCARISNAC